MGILPPNHAARNLAKLLSHDNPTSEKLNTAAGRVNVAVWAFAPRRTTVRERYIPLLKQAMEKVSGKISNAMSYRINNLQRYCEVLSPIKYRPQP